MRQIFDLADLGFLVTERTADGQGMVRVLAVASNLRVARAAFEGAKSQYPDTWLALQHGIRVIEERDPDLSSC